MKGKLKILRIITSLDPKFGGPSRGVLESSKQCKKFKCGYNRKKKMI